MLVLSLPQELATLPQQVSYFHQKAPHPKRLNVVHSSSRPNPWHCKKDTEVEATMLKCCFLQLLGKFFPR